MDGALEASRRIHGVRPCMPGSPAARA